MPPANGFLVNLDRRRRPRRLAIALTGSLRRRVEILGFRHPVRKRQHVACKWSYERRDSGLTGERSPVGLAIDLSDGHSRYAGVLKSRDLDTPAQTPICRLQLAL